MIHQLLVLVLVAGPPSLEWAMVPSGGIVAVECAGDVNSDGTDDIFAASDEALGYGIMCLDGITGETIWLNDSIPGAFATGCLRAMGDADLDGISDLAVGTGLNFAITALSGATGDVLWSIPQSNPIYSVQYAEGSEPGNVAVLATRKSPGENCTFFALDGQTGSALWSSPTVATQDSWIRITDSDVSGNGWSEMGYSVDRGSAMNGGVIVRDGYTGVYLQGSSTMYFGTMDICDSSPIACLAVSHFGDYPVMWMNLLTSGATIWSSNEANMSFPYLDFLPNITGPSTPYPEVTGWGGSNLMLIRGDDGYHQDWFEFPSSIQSVDCFIDDAQWRLALVTTASFHCPYLVFVSPTVEPSISLPTSGGCDLCLLESDLYPTPLAAIAMSGSGSGVCVISTSWPVAVASESTIPLSETPSIRLLSHPAAGGIAMIGENWIEVVIMDIAGRVVQQISVDNGEQVFIPLPPGVYQLIEHNSGRLLTKATVLCE
jgi:hypothetical protein